MDVNPYLHFDGQCEAAFQFYERCLGGKRGQSFTYGSMPGQGQTPPGWDDKIMHTSLAVGSQTIMGSDVPPGRYQPAQGFSMSISLSDPAEAERIFKNLSEGGTVHMPLQETFWAVRFGMLADQFGIPWMVNCEKAH